MMKAYLSLVKFSHTIFALPFALTGYFLGIGTEDGQFSIKTFGLIVLCMVFARSAAMAFNRWVDRDIDAANPRTKVREIPAGVISAQHALYFVLINSVLFVATTWFINPLCFMLSPVALTVILGYSYTKRFTFLCHLILGLGLALAPVGAYLAVTEAFAWLPVLYGLAVLTWVSGFDIIYALQDAQFDQENQLHSIPSYFGSVRALRISQWLHLFTGVFMVLAAQQVRAGYSQTDWLYWLGTLVFLTLLIYQHYLVKPNDLSRVNMAFFTTNGIASLLFGSMSILDLLT